MLGINVEAQENGRLSFGVISDTHFENETGEGAMIKVPKALKNLTSQAKLDALAVVGDLTNNGEAGQYEMLVNVFTDEANFINPVKNLFFMMGNHDYYNDKGLFNYQDGLKIFNAGEPYPLHQYKVIKGYPFITISMLTGGVNAYPDELKKQLDTWMAQASQECPGKPIFVFTHVPPQWTVYGSWPEFENGSSWGLQDLNPVLNKYPQTVVFAGHSHYPVGDPRSIHQGTVPHSRKQNYFTVINTGSTTYSEIHPGAVNAGIHPEGFAYVTEGMVVTELENGEIEIRRYDTYRNTEINIEHRWVLNYPFNGSMFKYADVRDADDNLYNISLRNGIPAPAFAKSAKISVEATPFNATIAFPQATDDECVFRYLIRLSKGKQVISERYIFSQFYLNAEIPNHLSHLIEDITPNTTYKVEVVAYDSYDNASQPLSTSFQTPIAE